MSEKGNTTRRAILVIHGIGQQRKFQTLGEFALGLLRLGLPGSLNVVGKRVVKDLCSKFRGAGLELFEHGPVSLAKGIKVGVEVFSAGRDFDSRVVLEIPEQASPQNSVKVDIYESYWAQATSGRTNVFKVLWWLIVTAFRSVSNVFAPRDPISAKPRSLQNNGRITAKILDFFRELGRFLMILALLYGIVIGISHAAVEIYRPFTNYPGDLGDLLNPENVAMTVLSIIYIFIAVQFMFKLLMGGLRIRWYLGLILTIVFIAVGIWLWNSAGDIRDWILQFAGALAIIFFFQRAFVDYLGDVEVYTSGSDTGRNRHIRREIIGKTRDKLNTILERKLKQDKPYQQDRPYYDEVIVIGHSLGSVIAYDVTCRALRKEGGRKARQARDRVKHLYTVGSPLDKIWYFFRDRSSADNPLYQGILGKLKGVKASGFDNSPLSDLEWTNIWTFTDVISGGLEEYGDKVENVHEYSLLPLVFVNHIMYWGSSNVMRRIGQRIFE